MVTHLHARSWFSFLAGGSPPEALARRASELGQEALALTDLHGVYGLVRFAAACRKYAVRPILGGTLLLEGFPLVLLAATQEGYRLLCQLFSRWHAGQADLPERGEGLLCLTGGPEGRLDRLLRQKRRPEALRWLDLLRERFPGALYVELANRRQPGDAAALERLVELARLRDLPCVASNAVRLATPDDFPRLDAL
ncbi:MAG: PHP domain-containing protein, partial [Candidatus Eremiobacterota bacterium]